MKLYEVKIEAPIYVVAHNEKEAKALAHNAILIGEDPDYDCIESPSSIWASWKNRLPYGIHKDKTVEQWKKEQEK